MYGNDEEGEGEDAGDAELPHDSQSKRTQNRRWCRMDLFRMRIIGWSWSGRILLPMLPTDAQ